MQKKLIYILLLISLFSLPFGCQTESYDFEREEGSIEVLEDGRLRVPILLHIPEREVVETKSAPSDAETIPNDVETTIQNAYVLVFDLTTDESLLQCVEATQDQSDKTKIYADLKTYPDPCLIQILVNLSPGNETKVKEAKKLDDIRDLFEEKINSLDLNPALLPLSSARKQYDDISATNINLKEIIALKFSYARIDVDAKDIKDQFILHEAYVFKAARQGYVIEHSGIPSDDSGTQSKTCSATENNINGIYVFENNGAKPENTQGSNPTDLIIKGKNGGFGEGFYKIRIAYLKKNIKTYDIRRGVRYAVKITSVKGPGYTSAEEAEENEPSNVEYDITVNDGSSKDVIVSNGKYYLGVSNSEFVVYDNKEPYSYNITTLTHNAPDNITKTLNATTGITLESQIGQPNVSTDIKCSLDNGFSTGSINIRIGDIIKNISIIRREMTSNNSIISDFATSIINVAEYIGNNTMPSWIKVGASNSNFNSNKNTYSTGQGIFFQISANNSSDTRCEFSLSRNNSQGTIKTHFYRKRTNNTGLVYLKTSGELAVGNWGTEVNINNILLFRLGGLVGISANETSSPWNSRIILYNPTSMTFNNQSELTETVPYYANVWDNPGIRNISDTRYHNSTNIKGGKGDICKLIGLTAQQIKDRIDLDNFKSGWKMPNISNSLTFTGQGNVNYTFHWNSFGIQNGGYFPKGLESSKLNFIPAIGYRAENGDIKQRNKEASYWLSDTSGPNNGYIFYFNSSSINPSSTLISNNRYFLPVRCTPE